MRCVRISLIGMLLAFTACGNSNPTPPKPAPAPGPGTVVPAWPPGYVFKGCTAVGHSCTESICPGKCEVLPSASPDPRLCTDQVTPLPCVCICGQ